MNELELKRILEGVWHSRSVDDVVPEIMALIAQREQAAYERGKREVEAVAQQEHNILGKELQESSDRIDAAFGTANHG